MGQINDRQSLCKLTEDVIAHRTHLWGGIGINRKWCLNEHKSEFIKKLLESGKIIRCRPTSAGYNKSSSGRTTKVKHIHPTPEKPICPVCKRNILYLPELNMTEHDINCRLRNYYN